MVKNINYKFADFFTFVSSSSSFGAMQKCTNPVEVLNLISKYIYLEIPASVQPGTIPPKSYSYILTSPIFQIY